MTDRPILFSAPMVRAILREIEQPGSGKTQTRRVLKPQPHHGAEVFCDGGYWYAHTKTGPGSDCVEVYAVEPRYAVGDRLWVRETWTHSGDAVWSISDARMRGPGGVEYRADGDAPFIDWFPSIFMPREFSRITLYVTKVRVERLQDISRGDALEEGCPFANMADGPNPRDWFSSLWDSINAKRGYGWGANPWVAVYTFKPVLGNIDQIEGE